MRPLDVLATLVTQFLKEGFPLAEEVLAFEVVLDDGLLLRTAAT